MCWLLDLLVLKTSVFLVGTEIRNTHGDIHNKSGNNASSNSANHSRKVFLPGSGDLNSGSAVLNVLLVSGVFQGMEFWDSSGWMRSCTT